jgi:hypothetical protein
MANDKKCSHAETSWVFRGTIRHREICERCGEILRVVADIPGWPDNDAWLNRPAETGTNPAALRPCPWIKHDTHDCGVKVSGGDPVFWFVACYNCQSHGPLCNSEAESIAAWNTRTDPLAERLGKFLGEQQSAYARCPNNLGVLHGLDLVRNWLAAEGGGE